MKNTSTKDFIGQWRDEEIELNQGTTIQNISEAEKKLGFVFPEDFKELYLTVDGFANDDWRPNMFSIWPIERILEEHNKAEDKNFIGFCDYLINSHQIGFIKDKTGIFISGNVPIEPIAENFNEAIRLINSDSKRIY